MPVVGTLWARNGGVVAHPDNAYRLLREQGQLVARVPRGHKGPGKTYNERYRLRRFGRGGFVEIAMRAGVPIVPIAVVGAEESMPILFKLPGAGQGARRPLRARSPPTCSLLGPLGALGYFPAKFKLRVLDPVTFDVAARPGRATRAAGSWTSPRTSASGSRKRSTTCSGSAARSGSADVGRRGPRHRARHVLGRPGRAGARARSATST